MTRLSPYTPTGYAVTAVVVFVAAGVAWGLGRWL